METKDVSTLDGASFATEPAGASVTVQWKDRAGTHELELTERVIAGSSPDAGLHVDDPTVSRVHAELEPGPQGLWIRDLGSRNGTLVNGVLVGSGRVPRSGRVHLGSALLTVRYGSGRDVEVITEGRFHGLVGDSLAMRRLFARLARVAPTDASVLLLGETGTGKEVVARALHEASPRARRPFVVVDCGAIPENLFESQLFGHAKGSFTGAVAARVGDIEAADGGTVFLDEVGELPVSVQPKLLRVLEARTVKRVGETEPRSVDVRIVSATHRDLGQMIATGAFREDLYFRLAVLPLTIPPLRERLEDVPALVSHFLRGRLAPELERDLAQKAAGRPWLGNVRELRNFVERTLAVGADEAIAMAEAARPSAPPPRAVGEPGGVSFAQRFSDFREQWIEHGERAYLTQILERHGRNVAAAAEEADVDRTYLYRLMRKHSL